MGCNRPGPGRAGPERLRPISGKPRIFVSEVTVGRTRQIAGPELALPPGTHHTEVHFDSISLRSPQNVRFQYRMDGIDPVWLDANSSLTAVYTNIPTGSHFFHVRACNNDGIWDPVGIAYKVTQKPEVYETTWFRGSAVLAVALLLAGAYRLRLRQIAEQFNARLEERVNERTRIARDLHDTLLQSFHGLMLRFQAVQNMLPEEPVKARQSLQTAIDRAAQAITEGRDAVQELRGAGLYGDDVVESLTSEGRELALEQAATQDGRARWRSACSWRANHGRCKWRFGRPAQHRKRGLGKCFPPRSRQPYRIGHQLWPSDTSAANSRRRNWYGP